MDLKPGELYQGLTGLISGHGGQKTGLRVLVWVLNGPGGGDAQCIITDKKSIGIFSCCKTLIDYSHSFLKTLTIVKQLREM